MTSQTPCLPECPSIKDWVDGLTVYGPQPDRHAPNCPNAPKPACEHEWGSMMVCTSCHTYRRPTAPPQDAKPQSEPPKYSTDPVILAMQLDQENIALKAERDTLKLAISEESGYLRNANAENAALKAQVEDLSEKLLWATSSYEERVVILTRREKRKEQEASNG